MHYKSTKDLGPELQVDKEQGIVKDVVIVKEGIDKMKGFFTKSFLEALINQGNASEKGIKCRFDHPSFYKSSLGTFLGRYQNFRLVLEEGEGTSKVLADLHLDPITQKTQISGQGISMWDYILEMSQKNPDVFGNSIVFNGKVQKQQTPYKGELIEVENYELENFIASDLVDMPAATDELFKSTSSKSSKEVLLKAPKVPKGLNILQRIIKNLLPKELTLSLIDGSLIKVLTKEGATGPEIGDELKDEKGIPLVDGTYELLDGKVLKVEEGLLRSIEKKPKEELTKKGGPFPQELQSQESQTQEELEAQKAAFKTFQKEVESTFEILVSKFNFLEKTHKELAKSIESSYPFEEILHRSKVNTLGGDSPKEAYQIFKEKYSSQA